VDSPVSTRVCTRLLRLCLLRAQALPRVMPWVVPQMAVGCATNGCGLCHKWLWVVLQMAVGCATNGCGLFGMDFAMDHTTRCWPWIAGHGLCRGLRHTLLAMDCAFVCLAVWSAVRWSWPWSWTRTSFCIAP